MRKNLGVLSIKFNERVEVLKITIPSELVKYTKLLLTYKTVVTCLLSL